MIVDCSLPGGGSSLDEDNFGNGIWPKRMIMLKLESEFHFWTVIPKDCSQNCSSQICPKEEFAMPSVEESVQDLAARTLGCAPVSVLWRLYSAPADLVKVESEIKARENEGWQLVAQFKRAGPDVVLTGKPWALLEDMPEDAQKPSYISQNIWVDFAYCNRDWMSDFITESEKNKIDIGPGVLIHEDFIPLVGLSMKKELGDGN